MSDSLYQSLSPYVRNAMGVQPSNYAQLTGMQMPGANLTQGMTLPTAGAAPATDPNFFQRMAGWTAADGTVNNGWGGMALGAASALGNLWMGAKQLNLAKDSLRENKRQFNLNYENQRKLTNNQLSDRQAARVAASPNAQSVSSYMQQWGV